MNSHAKKIALLAALYVGLVACSSIFSLQATTLTTSYYAGFTVRVQSLRTFDGYSFDFLACMPDNLTSVSDHSIPAIFVGHGLGNTKEDALRRGIHIARNGYVVLIPDLRGHGSHEAPIDLGNEWRDVSLMFDHVAASPLFSMVNMTNLGTWGHSNGAFQSVMTAIRDPRVKACVASSGAYNSSELITHEDSRLYIVGIPFDVNDPEQVKLHSPIELANTTNPRNLLLFAGDADDNVPHVHSQQLNATVNPQGNRTDYEYIVYSGEGHGIGDKQEVMQRSVAWFDKHLKNKTTSLASVSFFNAPFNKEDIEDAAIAAHWFLVVGYVPLVFIAETAIVLAWNGVLRKRASAARPERTITINYSAAIEAGIRNPEQLAIPVPHSKQYLVHLVTFVATWFAINIACGAMLASRLVSRVLWFAGLPSSIFFAFIIVHHVLSRKNEKPGASFVRRAFCGSQLLSGDVVKDIIVGFSSSIPAWLLTVLVHDLLSGGVLVHVALVGNLWDISPNLPVTAATFWYFLIFGSMTFLASFAFRDLFSPLSRGFFNNTIAAIKKSFKGHNVARFFLWLWLACAYALFSAGIILIGASGFLLPMSNPPMTETDVYIPLNVVLALAFAVIAFVATLIQQLFEKSFRSFTRAAIVATFILLYFFLSITPRPV